MAESKTFGVGVRYGVLIKLDSNGLPKVDTTSATPVQGSLVSGIKTVTVTDPEPRRITHLGDDLALMQDTLPAQEIGSFAFTSSASNMIIDTMIEDTKIREINGTKWRGVNTDKKGNEPLLGFMTFRQALDGNENSPTYGQKRQWEVKIYASTRIVGQSRSFEAAETDMTYQAIPTPTVRTLWGESFLESTWGHATAEAIAGDTDYQPRLNWWLGNGTITAFALSHAPATSTSIEVWTNGTLVAPASVSTNVSTPNMTLTSPPGLNHLVFALIETANPGNS